MVHPKNKCEVRDTAGMVYQIPCKDCPKIYTGVTRRKYGAQEKEHKGDMNTLDEVKFTRSRKKDSLNRSAHVVLTDHVAQNVHIIDWGSVKLPTKEDAWIT